MGEQQEEQKTIKLGVSSCLLGHSVRYDGGHKQDRYITDILSSFFHFVPVCPEVECGLPIPREAMHLEGEPANPRLVGVRSGTDHTERMRSWSQERLVQLEKEGLCGYIFKSKSPSSGLLRVKVYDGVGGVRTTGVGLFARAFQEHFPFLPVEEEGRLNDLRLRENFIESVFVCRRWRDLVSEPSVSALVEFHTRHKLLLLAHSEKTYRLMGPLVAAAGRTDLATSLSCYQQHLMTAMRLLPTERKHVNVLMHMLGYFKARLSADEKQEMLELIERFRQGHVPLIVPLTLINHYVRKYYVSYLAQQYYLNPHPVELRLRNHA